MRLISVCAFMFSRSEITPAFKVQSTFVTHKGRVYICPDEYCTFNELRQMSEFVHMSLVMKLLCFYRTFELN